MMGNTKIEWAQKVWNPVVGCTKCSPGCDNCYAERMACRLAYMGQRKYEAVLIGKENENWGFFPKWNNKVVCDEKVLDQPLHWKKPCRIFVCSMSDLFHPKVPFEFFTKIMAMIEQCKQHTFLALTKRPERMAYCFEDMALPKNLWLGVTVCNQAEADEKIPILLQIPAAKRFISIEPCLSPVDLLKYLKTEQGELNYDKKPRNNVFGPNEDRDVQGGFRGQDMENGQDGGGQSQCSGISKTLPEEKSRKKQVSVQDDNVHGKSKEIQGLCSSNSLDGSLPNSDTARARNQSQGRGQRPQPSYKSGDINSAGECNPQLQGVRAKKKGPERRKERNGKTNQSTGIGNKETMQQRGITTERNSSNVSDNPKRGQYYKQEKKLVSSGISLVIIGAESGANKRYCPIENIRSVVQQCKAANVPVFVKQVHLWGKKDSARLFTTEWVAKEFFKKKTNHPIRYVLSKDMSEWPADLRLRQLPD